MATSKDCITQSYNLIDNEMILCENNKGKYITSNYLQFGDYDDSSDVHRSNVAYIEENYTKNRYHVVYGYYSFRKVYLKNTDINAELIVSLDDCMIINDDYYYQWQSDNAYEQFMESSISDFPVIEKALNLIDSDLDWTLSDKIYDCLHYFSELWNGGQSYYWSGNCYYYTMMEDRYSTDDNVLLVHEWLIDNGVYSKYNHDELPLQLSPIIDRLYKDSLKSGETYIYCLQLQSYHDVMLHHGGSDYMNTHEYPFQEIEIDYLTTKKDITSLLIYTYDSICESNYEQLDISPI